MLDINCNSLGGLYNTLFLYHHGRLSPDLFLPLANFIKAWAKKRVCPHSTDSSTKVTSYSLAIILLVYLLRQDLVADLLVPPLYGEFPPPATWISKQLRTVDRKGIVRYYPQAFSTGRQSSTRSHPGLVNTLYGFFHFLTVW